MDSEMSAFDKQLAANHINQMLIDTLLEQVESLKSENQRMQAVVEAVSPLVGAARELLTNDDRDGLQVTISYRALETVKRALAALDASEGGGE